MKARSARRGRLTRSVEFERVYRQGKSSAGRHLVVYSFPDSEVEEPRVGLSVSRKVGGSVERNRVKRILREAVAAARPRLRPGQDIVVVARPPVLGLIENEGSRAAAQALKELLLKVGALEPARGQGEKDDQAASTRPGHHATSAQADGAQADGAQTDGRQTGGGHPDGGRAGARQQRRAA